MPSRPHDGAPTDFAEPEDFDLGLFLANVLGDPARCERMYLPSAQ
ncbi:hypothetical protein ACFVGY_28335 [Streptomyces sp. NPDC127106]